MIRSIRINLLRYSRKIINNEVFLYINTYDKQYFRKLIKANQGIEIQTEMRMIIKLAILIGTAPDLLVKASNLIVNRQSKRITHRLHHEMVK